MEGLASLRTKLNGQEHSLAWINRNEAQALKDMGGSGKPGPMGIPAYDSVADADSMDSGTASGDPNQPDDEYDDDFMQAAYGAPGFADAVDPGFGYIDDFFSSGFGPNIGFDPTIDPNTGYIKGSMEGLKAAANPNADAIDVSNMVDAQIDALERGLDVDVGYDPESGTLTYDGPDAFGYGLGSIGRGLGSLADFSRDMYMGLTALTPLGLIRDTLMGAPNTPGGSLRGLAGFPEAPIDPKGYLGLGIQGFVMGDPYSKSDFFSKASKDLGISDAIDSVIDSVKDAFGPEVAEQVKEETKGMTEQEFKDYMERTFGDEQYKGLYKDQI